MKGLVVSIVVAAGCAGFGHKPPPAPPRTTRLGLDIEQFALTNGLRVVVVADPSASEASVTMRYRVGAIDDPAGQAGIAHLVEHLMFQQVLGAESLFAHLEGAATYFNAETSFDATTYLARANPDKLAELLSIEAVRAGLRCVSINDSTFEREREVVINELRQRSAATEILEVLHRAAYPEGHPYRTAIGGSEASVAAITRAQACSFADAHYAPGNAVLVVSGKVTVPTVEAALEKFMAHVTLRAVTAQVDVPAVSATAVRSQVVAPLDHDAVLVTWPLPTDPLSAIRMRALANKVAQEADNSIAGQLGVLELGDAHAPLLAFFAVPGDGETTDAVIEAIDHATTSLDGLFAAGNQLGELAFDRMQQSSIYGLFSSLDEGSDRDTRIAIDVLAGRDPNAVIGAQFKGLRELRADESARLTRSYLAFSSAHVVVLKANGAHPARDVVRTAVPPHDVGQRRDPPDPDLALAPMVDQAAPPAVAMQTRTLANGMRVVLLPGATVPTVEMRMIFDTGTGDEPTAKRGVGLLAADTLTWDYHYLNDLLLFSAAGGSIYPVVGLDHTSFVARGLDMHLDLLLAGLRRVVREGLYEDNPAHIAEVLHRAAKRDDENLAMADAWRAARFGAGHPYRIAGVTRFLSPSLLLADVQAFRSAHYQPANATLVIAGHFDAALADRWIEFLFADWTGSPADPRRDAAATPSPVALASYKTTSQTSLSIALPVRATSSTRASQLIAAEMLASVAEDIRHQLGASYGVSAELSTDRLASEYLLAGLVESAQLADALKLLSDRLAELRSDPNAASRAFITSRARVVVRLRSLAGGASALARRVEADVKVGAPPLSDLETARAAAALTIDQEMATLADLDLAHAVIALTGPQREVTAAYAVLGRPATDITVVGAQKLDDEATAAAPPDFQTSQHVRLEDVEPAITEQGTDDPWSLAIAAGWGVGSVRDLDVSGPSLAVQIGHEVGEATLGLHLEFGRLAGSYPDSMLNSHDVIDLPVEVAAFAEGEAYDRLFASVFLGLHLNLIDDTNQTSKNAGIGAGLTAGVDLWRDHHSRLALYGRLQGELLADTGFSAFTAGLAFRRK